MKIQTLILGLLISFTSIAQTGIQFDKTTYNYGKIKKGIHKSVIFSFLNSNTAFGVWRRCIEVLTVSYNFYNIIKE